MAMRLHFGLDEHPFATYFDVHQGYRILTHSPMVVIFQQPLPSIAGEQLMKLSPLPLGIDLHTTTEKAQPLSVLGRSNSARHP